MSNSNLHEVFGCHVFSEALMRERLPKATFLELKNTIENGTPLNAQVADVVANAMKDWAIENGATHYTHWFQPLNGFTAEKHDSFLNLSGREGHILTEFSGKSLIMPPVFPPAACVQPLKRAAIRLGTAHHLPF